MSIRSRASRHGRPTGHEVYRERFLRSVHHLIGRGFQSLEDYELSSQEEPVITGMLTAAIEAFLDDPASPAWTERYFVQDEHHLSDGDRQGKSRLRVDIELTSSGHRPRPRFQIEAKRLRQSVNSSLAAYFGDDGLGCFLQGKYAQGHPWAGMMGYVQSGTGQSWSNRIRARLAERPHDFSLRTTSNVLCSERLDPLLPDVYRSDHRRIDSRPIEIHHFLLQFC